MTGRYDGRFALTFLPDGRRVRLLEAIRYIDPAELAWDVPADAIVDGASIPRALWTIVGGPFEGLYREASVIHDWYCDRRNRPWRAVHRVFYDAMRTSGVDELQAKIMYAAVYAGGPRWSDTVVENNRLEASRTRNAFGPKASIKPVRPPLLDRPELKLPQLQALVAQLNADVPSLDEIEAIVEQTNP